MHYDRTLLWTFEHLDQTEESDLPGMHYNRTLLWTALCMMHRACPLPVTRLVPGWQ